MPLTDKGNKIKEAMLKQYGGEKGEAVFYASMNKGTIEGVEANEDSDEHEERDRATVRRHNARSRRKVDEEKAMKYFKAFRKRERKEGGK